MQPDHEDGKTYTVHTLHMVSVTSHEISFIPFYVVGVIAIAGVVYFVRRKRRSTTVHAT